MSVKGKIIAGLLLFGLCTAPLGGILFTYRQSHATLQKESTLKPGSSTRLFDVNGELIAELFQDNRSPVPLSKISGHARNAFIIAEDRNFYSHSGIDFFGISRALIADLIAGEFKQGGSTITQQLAKQLYAGSEKTFRRKITELFIARELEKRYSKDRILEMYLNMIYFGHGVYGISAASRFFFNREPDELGPAQAALLAAIPASPRRFSPLRDPKAACIRSQQILHDMISEGVAGRDEATASFAGFWPGYLDELRTRSPEETAHNAGNDRAPYFTEYVRQELMTRLGGGEEVYRGGYEVRTTLDLRQQELGQRILAGGLESHNQAAAPYNSRALDSLDGVMASRFLAGEYAGEEERRRARAFSRELRESLIEEGALVTLLCGAGAPAGAMDRLSQTYALLQKEARVEGALVALDPRDGGITAMTGGAAFSPDNQLNRAVQTRRQPGSAFKPFVYCAGIEAGKITAGTVFIDLPVYFKSNEKSNEKEWAPENYDRSFYGRVSVRRALAGSLNVVSVLVYDEIGGAMIASLASRVLQVPRRRFTIDPSLALGTSELTPLELARGYAVFANGGLDVVPHAITSIADRDGNIVYSHEAPERATRLVSKQSSFIITDILRDVIDRGTAREAIRSEAGFDLPAAGKTGTTTNFRDAWFAGYTADLAVAVWIGCDSQAYTLGPGRGGSLLAAPLWGAFMRDTYGFREYVPFPARPEGVEECKICSITGKLPGESCPLLREYFRKGTAPRETCAGDHEKMMSVDELVKERERREQGTATKEEQVKGR